MDPNNGDVLALDNYPKYDPNFPRKSLDEKEQKLFESLSDEAVTENIMICGEVLQLMMYMNQEVYLNLLQLLQPMKKNC